MDEHMQALRESEERFRQLAENIDQVFWLTDIAMARVLYVNRAYEEIWGLAREDLYRDGGRWLDAVHPADRPMVEAALPQPPDYPYDMRYRVVRPDGEVRWIHDRAVPVRGPDGSVYRLAGVAQDITQMVEAERALRARDAHYRRLVETSPYAVYTLDRDGCFEEINHATEVITGRPAQQLLGEHFSSIVHPDDLPESGRVFHDLMEQTTDRADLVLRVMHPVDGARWLSIAVVVVIDEASSTTGVHGIARDITEERARDQHLRRAERLATMGTLVGGVAHELNNPLQAISGFAELLLAGEQQEEDQRQALATISREAKRASRIVADLRLLARRAREETRRAEAVDVNEVVGRVLRSRRHGLATVGVEVQVDAAPSLPVVTGDAARLEQALLNLVVNAEQALAGVERSRQLLVRTRASGRGVAVTVRDNGPGIPAESLPHLFDPFWTTKAPGEGIGLGLSIVHTIVQDHGGRVHVESEPGRGTTFQLDLPSAEQAHTAPDSSERGVEAVAAVPAVAPPAAPMRILVVDDEAAIRRLLVRLIERRGHHVDEAGDGAEALERIDESATAYDLIISDLRMPGVGGERLAEVLLERDPAYRDRIVLLTGDPTGGEAARVKGLGDIRLLAKPLGLEDLLRMVADAEGRRAAGP